MLQGALWGLVLWCNLQAWPIKVSFLRFCEWPVAILLNCGVLASWRNQRKREKWDGLPGWPEQNYVPLCRAGWSFQQNLSWAGKNALWILPWLQRGVLLKQIVRYGGRGRNNMQATCATFWPIKCVSTVRVDSLPHRKWKETKQQSGMLPGPAVPGCCLVSFHFLWGKLSTRTVYQCAPFPPPCRYLASTCEGVSFLFLCQKMLTLMAIEGEGLYFGRVAFPTEFTLLFQYQHKTLAPDYSTIWYFKFSRLSLFVKFLPKLAKY